MLLHRAIQIKVARLYGPRSSSIMLRKGIQVHSLNGFIETIEILTYVNDFTVTFWGYSRSQPIVFLVQHCRPQRS